MGLFRKPSGYRGDATPFVSQPLPPLQPNPQYWKLIRAEESGTYCILEVKYPDCTNYEGKKILVMENTKIVDLVNMRTLDPHFYASNKIVARFRPTDEGWKMAQTFVTSYRKG